MDLLSVSLSRHWQLARISSRRARANFRLAGVVFSDARRWRCTRWVQVPPAMHDSIETNESTASVPTSDYLAAPYASFRVPA
jgi:hypothetical protein